MTVTTAPLPTLGLCPYCEGEIRCRKNGTLYAHQCAGDGHQPAATLEPTFVRWLHAQSRRHDGRSNDITGLAQAMFNGCTRTGKRTPMDVTWTTAEELHAELHQRQKRLSGSEIRQPYNGRRCDWMCNDLRTAADAYASLRQA